MEEAFCHKVAITASDSKNCFSDVFGAGTLLQSRISIPETKGRQPQLVKRLLRVVVIVTSAHRSLLPRIDVAHSAWRGSGRQ